MKCVAVEVNATGSSKAPSQQEGWLGTGPSTATSLVSPLICTKPGTNVGWVWAGATPHHVEADVAPPAQSGSCVSSHRSRRAQKPWRHWDL